MSGVEALLAFAVVACNMDRLLVAALADQALHPSLRHQTNTFHSTDSTRRQIDVEERGSVDKAQVISALQSSGEADYDSVDPMFTSS